MVRATFFTFILLQALWQQPAIPVLLIAPPPALPPQTVGTGVVILEGLVTREGQLMDIRVLEGTSAFIEPSLRVVRQWEFEPAEETPGPPRRTNITFFYRERTILPQRPFEFSLGADPLSGDHPPLPMHIVDPGYPANSIGRGSVIVQGRINTAGEVERVDVVRPEPSLTEATVSAVQRWKFRPSMWAGRPAQGSAIVVVIFQPPALTTR